MKVKKVVMIDNTLKKKLDQEAKKKDLSLDELVSIKCER